MSLFLAGTRISDRHSGHFRLVLQSYWVHPLQYVWLFGQMVWGSLNVELYVYMQTEHVIRLTGIFNRFPSLYPAIALAGFMSLFCFDSYLLFGSSFFIRVPFTLGFPRHALPIYSKKSIISHSIILFFEESSSSELIPQLLHEKPWPHGTYLSLQLEADGLSAHNRFYYSLKNQ